MQKKIVHWAKAPTSLVMFLIAFITAVNLAFASSGCPKCGTKSASEPPGWAPSKCNGCKKNKYPYCVGSGADKECLDNGPLTNNGNCCGKSFRSYSCKMGTNSC